MCPVPGLAWPGLCGRSESQCRNSQGRHRSLPFNDETFDGIFSYSVVYLTDWRKSLAEFARCLKPDGLLYVNTNGLGWYLLDFVEDRQSVEGYSSKVMARDALANTIRYYSENRREEGHCIVMPSDIVVSHLSHMVSRSWRKARMETSR